MRRRTVTYITLVSLLCWIVAISYIFTNRPPFRHNKPVKYEEVQTQLQDIEERLKGQREMNKELLEMLNQLQNSFSMTNKNLSGVPLPFPRAPSPIQSDPVIAVLMFACNRVTVKRSLDQIIKFRREFRDKFPIIVSQDCVHEQTTRVIESYKDDVTLIRQPDQSDIPLVGKAKKFKGYYKIARHYVWALNQTFHVFDHDTVIVVEDDLDIAPDFFEYFRAMYPILKSDPTLYCISAWNDNGKEGIVDLDRPEALHRSDFFPGLGWMLTKDLWYEYQSKWPKAFWDDWIREPAQRKDRACIRPEVSRTKTFGKIGVSNGLFFEKHLKFIKLNDKFVPFTKTNVSYLIKENYDVAFLKSVYGSPSISLQQLWRHDIPRNESVRITYNTRDAYKKMAKALGIMDDFKSGVPRTGYRGVVSFMSKGQRVYLAPPPNWKKYDTSWT